jgi:hypothetical protein
MGRAGFAHEIGDLLGSLQRNAEYLEGAEQALLGSLLKLAGNVAVTVLDTVECCELTELIEIGGHDFCNRNQ